MYTFLKLSAFRSSQFKSVTGPDHIGIGGDSTPDGLDDFSKYPDLFDILANGAYNDGTTLEPWTREDLQ